MTSALRIEFHECEKGEHNTQREGPPKGGPSSMYCWRMVAVKAAHSVSAFKGC